jgi:hypothetical protein
MDTGSWTARLLANPLPFTHNPRWQRGSVAIVRAFSVQRVQGGFMFAVRLRTFHFGLLLATALPVSMWATAGQAYTPEEQQACSDDAFRVCGPEIPDVDRVTACMIRNKSQLSPGCRVFFRSSEPVPAATRATTGPLSISPATEQKPVKPRQSKKPRKSDSTS